MTARPLESNNSFWHRKVIKMKSRQTRVFGSGGYSGRLRGCLFWEGGACCIVGGSVWNAAMVFETRFC